MKAAQLYKTEFLNRYFGKSRVFESARRFRESFYGKVKTHNEKVDQYDVAVFIYVLAGTTSAKDVNRALKILAKEREEQLKKGWSVPDNPELIEALAFYISDFKNIEKKKLQKVEINTNTGQITFFEGADKRTFVENQEKEIVKNINVIMPDFLREVALIFEAE